MIAPVWGFYGGTMVIQGAFRGAGQTGVAMALSLLSRWIFRVPVAVAVAYAPTVVIPGLGEQSLGLGIGVMGIWIGYGFGGLAAFLVAAAWFARGNWTAGVVEEGDDRSEPALEGTRADDGE